MRSKGLIDIYILEILEKHASVHEKLTQENIMNYLEKEYNLKVSRKTLSGYLALLREENYIKGERGIYKEGRFSDSELRLLIDGVLFGQHIPKDSANQLIEKLKGFSYKNLRKRVKHVCYLEKMNHTQNETLYEIIDTIDEAIGKNKKILLSMCKYNENGKLEDRGTKEVSPYYLVTEKSRYYLICYAGRNNDVENRRVDRIAKVEILEENRKEIKELEKYKNGFNLGNYMKEHLYMFSGDSAKVIMKINKEGIGDFIDWYGTDYQILEKKDEAVKIAVSVNKNALYYWTLQYSEIAEIIEPIELRNRMRIGIEEILKNYEK